MSKTIPELRIALFGPSASGKTTFLASYFGNQQRHSFEKSHGYRLEASDVSDGNQLLSRYYRMEAGTFPLGTERFSEYRFGFKVGDIPTPSLHVVWYDYPGGWWEHTPKDESEEAARRDALEKLLTSHVGILMIDGQRYLAEGLPYVRYLLDQFSNEARRLTNEFAGMGTPLGLPSQWIIAISKADLLPPGATAESIGKEIIMGAVDQLQGVQEAVDPNAKSFGTQFLLLASVRGDGNTVVDAYEFIGLPLVAPVALLSVVSELAEKGSTGAVYGVARSLVERLSRITDLIDRLDDFLPPKYQVLTHLLNALSLKEGLDKGAEYFRQKQMSHASKGRALEAAAAAMRAELASPTAERAFFRSQN